MNRLAFDRVLLETTRGREELTVERFLALPLPVRVKHILSRSIAFFDNGVPVEQKLALASLRNVSAR
jgi:hypothetical protein